MGLYLCAFDGDDELEGVEVGSYLDFENFRGIVTERLEGGVAGSRFPTLIIHSDCDGEWSVSECEVLRRELTLIANDFQQMPALPFQTEWQQQVANLFGLKPSSLNESFIDVDGELLLDRLIQLCDVAIKRTVPIVFQ